MKATFELKIYNDTTLKGMKCSMEGTVGNNVVTLRLKGDRENLEIQLSAAELVLASGRLAGGQDGKLPWPTQGASK